jgi:hypothetical protein
VPRGGRAFFKIGVEYRRRSEKLGSECVRLEVITIQAVFTVSLSELQMRRHVSALVSSLSTSDIISLWMRVSFLPNA